MLKEAQPDKPLAVIGDEDIVVGFKALGFKVYALREPEEYKAAIDAVVSQPAAVCLVQENIYRRAENEINSYKDLPLPVFIPFSKNAETALLNNIVRDIRLRATGTI
jgi:vacuolar-type H+-ATPase subunit F/Vma7